MRVAPGRLAGEAAVSWRCDSSAASPDLFCHLQSASEEANETLRMKLLPPLLLSLLLLLVVMGGFLGAVSHLKLFLTLPAKVSHLALPAASFTLSHDEDSLLLTVLQLAVCFLLAVRSV